MINLVVGTFTAVILIEALFTVALFNPITDAIEPPFGLVTLAKIMSLTITSNFAVSELVIS